MVETSFSPSSDESVLPIFHTEHSEAQTSQRWANTWRQSINSVARNVKVISPLRQPFLIIFRSCHQCASFLNTAITKRDQSANSFRHWLLTKTTMRSHEKIIVHPKTSPRTPLLHRATLAHRLHTIPSVSQERLLGSSVTAEHAHTSRLVEVAVQQDADS